VIRILVTGVGSGGHGEQIVKALSLEKYKEYEIFGADANSNLVQSELAGGFVHRLPYANEPSYVDEVLKLCKRLQIDAVFHGSEPELRALAAHRENFEEVGILLLANKTEIIELALDKARLSDRLTMLGFKVPRFLEVSSLDVLEMVDWFPAVLKPSTGGGGSRDVYIVQDPDELKNLARFLHLDESGTSFIIQEYVGSEAEEYTVGVLHDFDGSLIGSIGMKRDLSSTLSVRSRVKNRTARTELGDVLVVSSGVSQGRLGAFREVTEQCEAIAESLGSAGPLNIQCRLVSGEVKVFEINPRFSGTTSSRALAGFNEPLILLDRHFGVGSHAQSPQVVEGIASRSLLESFLPSSGP